MRAFLWQRWFAGAFDGNGGAHLAGAWRLPMDLMDLMDQMDNLGGAIVYPVGLPRCCGGAGGGCAGGVINVSGAPSGIAHRNGYAEIWCKDLLQGRVTQEICRRGMQTVCLPRRSPQGEDGTGRVTPRPQLGFFLPSFFHLENYPRAFGGSPGGVTNPLWWLQQRRNRNLAFFAKLFFT